MRETEAVVVGRLPLCGSAPALLCAVALVVRGRTGVVVEEEVG